MERSSGSSVSDIQTTATPTDQGFYRIKGQKVFISAGDHDQADNVVHLMLAKIPGGPPGVKGLSLVLVPKYRIGSGAELEPNDVIAAGIFHKMGYRGCPPPKLLTCAWAHCLQSGRPRHCWSTSRSRCPSFTRHLASVRAGPT